MIIILFCYGSYSQTQHKLFNKQNQDELHLKIQQTLRKNNPLLKNLGLIISEELSQSSNIYLSHNSNKKFIPASLSKIITASVILDAFPSHQTFKTSFVSQQNIKEGVLEGPLYLKGGGDPSFVSESLWVLVNHLTRTGLKRVRGPLIVDESLFKPYQRKKNRWFSSDRSYSSYLSPLSFNWNSLTVYVRPGKLGKPAQVFVDPKTSLIQIRNQTVTKKTKKDHHLFVSRRNYASQDVVHVRGSISPNASEFISYKNVSQPALWAGYNAIEFLKQRGILFDKETVQVGRVSAPYSVLAQHKGRTISHLVRDMMKYSSNFIADMLTIQLSLLKGDTQGSLKKGMEHIHQSIRKKGITDYSFNSPSGLSQKNLLKPKDILTFLIHDFHSSKSFEKISAFAIPQGIGSLKERIKDAKNPSFIRAKTGMMLGVMGLAGYVKNKKGKWRAFVFMYNGKNRYQAQHLFDELAFILSLKKESRSN